MRTRTLLLLALGCGLAIVAAGVTLFVKLGRQPVAASTITIGDIGRAGDITVVVDEFAADPAGNLVVTVRIGGVDDADALDGFRLIGDGQAVGVDRANPATTCAAVTVESTTCDLAFAAAAAGAGQRRLLFTRADEQLRWAAP